MPDIEDRIGVDVQPGDTVHLMSGYHGEVQLSGISAATPIVLAAEEGHEPHLGRLAIQGSSGLTLRGLWVSPEYAPSYSNADIVSVSDDSSAIVIEGFTIHSVADASGWTDPRSRPGIRDRRGGRTAYTRVFVRPCAGVRCRL